MKKIALLLSLGLLAASAPAFAQKAKAKPQTETPTTDPAAPAPAAPQTAQAGVGKAIPVAEYYEGGQEAMYAFIENELKYPILAKRNRIQGTCIVSFTLNTDGTMSGIKLVKNIGGGCGEEALRVVRLLKFKKPDYAILTSLPVPFKL
ncbi:MULTISPECIES: energy transducer TonB [Hymenobacter]|uniref:Energy transducer TonB n=1 Tax=Hymenobacter jejuensis TaxID=2502781 RepID=A0A5B8A4V2_9BACT|nr:MULTISPECIES: energy transducer TonB [Hymenobacter]MBC6990225.1 energy transducer TonB [Hymenobacter sp. BT491]QDA62239.1 energy transducer TonB [Hymenobacter jejuensis]